ELPADRRSSVEAVLQASPDARVYVARVTSLLDALRASAAPSVELLRRLESLSETPVTADSIGIGAALAWVTDATRVVATLLFDSRAQPALAGVRGADETRQLIYETEAGRLDVTVAAGADAALAVRGQLRASTDGTPGEVVLARTGTEESVAMTRADARGRFGFSVPVDRYDLYVQLGRRAVIAEDVGMA
ncbi:MAG: hypothetical protein ACYTGR_06215, partial [Planctomycetota bacterium]